MQEIETANKFLKHIFGDYASMYLWRFNEKVKKHGKDPEKVLNYYKSKGCVRLICYGEHIEFRKLIQNERPTK